MFGRSAIARVGYTGEQAWIDNRACDFFPKRFDRILGAMIKDETSLAIANEIVEAAEIGDKHGATVRHSFERRQAESFAALCQ